MQGEHVAVPDERLPPIEVATVWLAGHAAPEPFEVALDDGTPLLQASRGQADGESARLSLHFWEEHVADRDTALVRTTAYARGPLKKLPLPLGPARIYSQMRFLS